MRDFFLLKILDLFAGWFQKSEVNYAQLRMILQVKFNMDRRKVPNMMRNMKINKAKDKNLFAQSMFFYVLAGLMITMFSALFSIKNLLLGETIFFTMLMMMITNMFILEFSMHIFDISDNDILLPRPVNAITVSIAKNLHLMLYMLGITLALTIPYIIFLGIVISIPVALITLIFSILTLLFIFFIASILFGILTKKYSGEKLKDVVNWVQIGTMLTAFMGYQIFNQLMGSFLENIDSVQIPNLIYLFPPTWFASGPTLFGGNFTFVQLGFALLAVLLSVVGYRLYLKKIAPTFEQNLRHISDTDQSSNKVKKSRFLKYGKLLKSTQAQAFYDFSLRILSRERKTKQAVYPLMAMGIFFPILMIFRLALKPDFNFLEFKGYFFLYYLAMMMLPLLIYCRYSENHKATWIYRYLPIKNPGNIIKGAHFAMFFSYQLPTLFIGFMVFAIFWKFTIIPQLLGIVFSCLIAQLLYSNMTDKIIPFSEEMLGGQSAAFKQGSYFITVFVFIPILGGLHFLSTFFQPGIYIYLSVQVVAIYLLYKNYYDVKWSEILEPTPSKPKRGKKSKRKRN